MAIYRLADEFDRKKFFHRAKTLWRRGSVVELSEKRIRTIKQNSYLHVILSYFATLVGEPMEYVKQNYFKLYVNSDLFVRQKNDTLIGATVQTIRSSSDLTTEELTLAIERFRNWASSEGYYIPSASDALAIQQLEIEISKNKEFL